MKKSNLIILLLSFLFFIIYKNWFLSPEIIGGDWPYFYPENIHSFSFFPPIWNSVQGNGMGGTSLVYGLDTYLTSTGWFFSNVLSIPWNVTYKLVWFGMFLALGVYASWRLLKELLPELPFSFISIGIFLFLSNTYVLMLVGGGQMGVALAYAVAPLVLVHFIRLMKCLNSDEDRLLLRQSLYAGLFLSIQLLFDIRIVYITLVAVGILFACHLKKIFQNGIKKSTTSIGYFVLSGIVALLLNAFWLLPLLFTGQNSVTQLGDAYTTTDAVTFFSFAKFENTLGLLHPNWPENVFGKVGFMKAEFLLLPLLAFCSLLFIPLKKKQGEEQFYLRFVILGFALLGLIGIFLSKGANDPFGYIYLWLFETVPGFVMYRDPTKWYLFIVLAYIVLIPFSTFSLYQWFQQQAKKKKIYTILPILFLILIFSVLLFLIRFAVLGQLGGTLSHREAPLEYMQLKELLNKDTQFSRTLWVPKMQRFGYVDQQHPAVEAATILNATNSAEMLKKLQKKDTERLLRELSIKYVVIPYDAEGEIFVKDRKYNSLERLKLEKELDNIRWLQKLPGYKKLSIYIISNPKDHFYLLKEGETSYLSINPTEYSVVSKSSALDTLIFAENYNPYWKARIGETSIENKRYNGMNSFTIPAGKVSDITVQFILEKYYIIGRVVSFGALLIIIVAFYYLNRKMRRKKRR